MALFNVENGEYEGHLAYQVAQDFTVPLTLRWQQLLVDAAQFTPQGVCIDNSQGNTAVVVTIPEIAYSIVCPAGSAIQESYPAPSQQTAIISGGAGGACVIFVDYPLAPKSAGSSGGGVGTVTSVGISGADGIAVANSPITNAGTIALSLGAITPASVASVGAVSGSNLSGTNTGDQTIALTGDVTGSGAGSFATTLATVNANVGTFNTVTVNAKGLVTAASNSGGGASSSGNRVRNGNFAINQRNVSGTVTLAVNAYGHDGWKAGSGGCTYTFATSGIDTTITITSGSLVQVIEGNLIEQTNYIMSWGGTAQGRIVGGAYAASPVALTATAGTNLSIELGVGTLGLVQVEPGATPTPFTRIPYVQQLIIAQRYLETVAPGSLEVYATNTSGSLIYCWYNFKVHKAGTPHVVIDPTWTTTNLTSVTRNSLFNDVVAFYGVVNTNLVSSHMSNATFGLYSAEL